MPQIGGQMGLALRALLTAAALRGASFRPIKLLKAGRLQQH